MHLSAAGSVCDRCDGLGGLDVHHEWSGRRAVGIIGDESRSPILSFGDAVKSGRLLAARSVVAGEYPFNRQILVQIGPVEAKRRKFDAVKLSVWFAFQSGITANRKRDLQPALHTDMNLAILVMGRDRLINQCAHASIEL